MNVTETTAEGLRRELKVVVGAEELEERLSSRLDELKGKAQIKGFFGQEGWHAHEHELSSRFGHHHGRVSVVSDVDRHRPTGAAADVYLNGMRTW